MKMFEKFEHFSMAEQFNYLDKLLDKDEITHEECDEIRVIIILQGRDKKNLFMDPGSVRSLLTGTDQMVIVNVIEYIDTACELLKIKESEHFTEKMLDDFLTAHKGVLVKPKERKPRTLHSLLEMQEPIAAEEEFSELREQLEGAKIRVLPRTRDAYFAWKAISSISGYFDASEVTQVVLAGHFDAIDIDGIVEDIDTITKDRTIFPHKNFKDVIDVLKTIKRGIDVCERSEKSLLSGMFMQELSKFVEEMKVDVCKNHSHRARRGVKDNSLFSDIIAKKLVHYEETYDVENMTQAPTDVSAQIKEEAIMESKTEDPKKVAKAIELHEKLLKYQREKFGELGKAYLKEKDPALKETIKTLLEHILDRASKISYLEAYKEVLEAESQKPKK